MKLRSATLALALFAFACGDDSSGTGGGGTGGGGTGGATSTSATSTSSVGGAGGSGEGAGGAAGTGGEAGTGGSGGAPFDYYGELRGQCGEIDDTDILDELPQLLESTLDFSAEALFVEAQLSAGGLTILADDNLGGSSLYSELFAFEVLHRCDGATLLETEANIDYEGPGKRTDLLVEIDGQRVGVSVVRAMSFPEGAPYPTSQAKTVLEGKLADILVSSSLVSPNHAWPKQILSVVAQTDAHADAVIEAYAMIDEATRADTIVFVTVTHGEDGFVYYNQ